MDIFRTMEKRHSCRDFKKGKISGWELAKITVMAKLAPSAGNLKAYEINIVTDIEKKEKLAIDFEVAV